jgi:hypothetical protein
MARAYFTRTPTFNAPILVFPETNVQSELTVPLLITEYRVPTAVPTIGQVGGIPEVNIYSSSSSGIVLPTMGPSQLPKCSISGFIDTPYEEVGAQALPTLWMSGRSGGSTRASYGDLIAMHIEGRAWAGLDTRTNHPSLFRDPYGRLFGYPRILDFSASYMEGRPNRQNFAMTLQIVTAVAQ